MPAHCVNWELGARAALAFDRDAGKGGAQPIEPGDHRETEARLYERQDRVDRARGQRPRGDADSTPHGFHLEGVLRQIGVIADERLVAQRSEVDGAPARGRMSGGEDQEGVAGGDTSSVTPVRNLHEVVDDQVRAAFS